MKIELNLENKKKFIAQYYNQKILKYKDENFTVLVWGDRLELKEIENTQLLLKSLNKITDEEALEIIEILELEEANYQIDEHQGLTIYIGDWEDFNHYDISDNYMEFQEMKYVKIFHIFQYLQSKGYALPYQGYTVNELIEAGWIILNN